STPELQPNLCNLCRRNPCYRPLLRTKFTKWSNLHPVVARASRPSPYYYYVGNLVGMVGIKGGGLYFALSGLIPSGILHSQGVALGYFITPRWGSTARRRTKPKVVKATIRSEM